MNKSILDDILETYINRKVREKLKVGIAELTEVLNERIKNMNLTQRQQEELLKIIETLREY